MTKSKPLATFTPEDVAILAHHGRGSPRLGYVRASIDDSIRSALGYHRNPEGAAAETRRRIAVWHNGDPHLPGPDHPDAVY